MNDTEKIAKLRAMVDAWLDPDLFWTQEMVGRQEATQAVARRIKKVLDEEEA